MKPTRAGQEGQQHFIQTMPLSEQPQCTITTTSDLSEQEQYKLGYAAGLKDGRRLERAALRRIIRPRLNDALQDDCEACCALGHDLIQDMNKRQRLASRKRKGGE